MNERIQEFLKEDSGLPDILKSYGTAAVVKFIAKYFPVQKQNEKVINFIRRTLLCGVAETKYDEPDWPEFSSSAFYYMLDNKENMYNANNVLSEVEEQEPYGLMPPPDLVLGVDRVARYKSFWRCLKIDDVLVCKVINYVPQENKFAVKLITFAERKYRYIEDLEIIIRLRVEDIPREINLKIGDYVQGVFYACNLGLRHFYISLKREHLGRATSIPLGVVTEEDFPLHYKLTKERPLNEIHEYMELSHKKYVNQLSNLTKAFNLDENKFYSIDLEMENFDVPDTEKISWICKNYTERMANHWFHLAKVHYDQGDIEKALEAYAAGFKHEPKNITALINRAAVHGNNLNFTESRSDLELALKIDPGNTRALQYFDNICKIQITEYEDQAKPLCVGNTACRLLFVPSNEDDAELGFKLIEATLESDFADLWTAFLDEVEETDIAQDTPTVEEAEDKSKKKQTLDSSVLEESRPPIRDVSGEGTSKGERRSHKKHSTRNEHEKHGKGMRRYHEYSRSPTHKRSRIPSSRHRKSSHKSRKSLSPTRSVQGRRSRSITPHRRRYSRSSSGHRDRKSRSPSPKRHASSSSYHYRKSPRSRRSSSGS